MRTACILLAACILVSVRADDGVKTVVDRAIKAAGGETELASAAGCTLKVKGRIDVPDQRIDVEGEWSLRGWDRFRWDATATVMNKSQTGGVLVHGDKAWLVGPDGKANPLPKELAAALQANLRTIRIVQNPLLLRDKKLTLSALGELKIDDRETVGLKISAKGIPDIDLFYDRKSHHPVKAEFRLKDTQDGREAVHVLRFDDHKEAGKLRHFSRLRWLRDDQQHLELEASAVKGQEQLDDSAFAVPEKK